MCGLAGILSPLPDDHRRLEKALHRLSHRGPDGEAVVALDADGQPADAAGKNLRLIFGFRRLAILDRTTAADQPMRCPHTGNLLVFNGEIYNFLELRTELAQLGHRFRTESDSEVILAAYAQWGEDAFARFNGMWALALHNAASGATILSRDRMGVKPFYYAQQGPRLIFASEVEALILLQSGHPALRQEAVFDFLASGQTDHTEAGFYEGIYQLPPASCWRVTAQGTIHRYRYHEWPEEQSAPPQPAILRELLSDAVKLRLRADAPTVSLLSGGLDSSLVTWLAAQANEPRSQFNGAFSYGYHHPAYAAHDETARAAAFMAALPKPIPHRIVRLDPVPTLDEYLAMTRAHEAPINTPSPIAGFRLYRAVREAGIKVVLTGEGADEAFLGYTSRYLPLLAIHHAKQRNWPALYRLLHAPPLRKSALFNRLAWYLPQPMLQRLLHQTRPHYRLLNRDFLQAHSSNFLRFKEQQRLPIVRLWREDLLRASMPQILRYADRNSMAAGVEARLPFMDYRLINYALSCPVESHLSAKGGKQLLRQAFRNDLPSQVVQQPKTHGFGHAEQFTLLKTDFRPLLERAPAIAWDYLDRARLAHQLARNKAHPLLWLPLSLLLWLTQQSESA